MSVTDEDLSAFADGMLDEAGMARVAAAVAQDASLEARVVRMRAAAAALKGAFDGQLAEPVPSRLTAMLARGARSPGQIIPFPASRRAGAWAMAAAAGLMLAFFGGRLSAPDQPMRVAEGRIVATGKLAQALNVAPSGGAGEVRIALTFANDANGYCRVFTLNRGAGSAGLACRSDGDWTIIALARGPGAGDPEGYHQAAGELPRVVLEAATEQRAGDPLDPKEELRAIRDGWRVGRAR